MDVWSVDKLLLVIGFVVPGFLSLKVYELFYPGPPRDSSQRLVDAIAYSSINYAILLWPIYRIEQLGWSVARPSLYLGFYVFAVLVAPILWVCLFRWLRNTRFLQQVLPHPEGKPWDFVFKRRACYWVIVTMRDGRKVGGRYDTMSFASSAPHPEQLYLEEAWFCNAEGGLQEPKPGSAGILILASDIETVDLFNL